MGEKRKLTDEEKREKRKAYNRTRFCALRQERVASGICVKCGKVNDRRMDNCSLCSERYGNRSKTLRKQAKISVIEKYGGVCQCCGESNYKFLTIDHINNNGRQESRRKDIYRYLVNIPVRSDLRLLCYNCNCGRAHNGGVCPHEEKQDDE